jgi:hypothetical protein
MLGDVLTHPAAQPVESPRIGVAAAHFLAAALIHGFRFGFRIVALQ